MENHHIKSSRIPRRAVKQGARPSMVNQVEVEKCTTGANSSNTKALESFQDESTTQIGPLDSRSTNQILKKPRQKWTREEYKQVMIAYYQALEQPSNKNTTNRAYELWRKDNVDNRATIDKNKLANVRRDIVKNKGLTDMELERIRVDVRKEQQPPIATVVDNSTNLVNVAREDDSVPYIIEENVEHLPHSG